MKNLKNITTVFSVMNDLVAYRKNQTETDNQSSQEQEPSSRTRLPLEVLYSDDTRSFFFEVDKNPIAIIVGDFGVAFEDAPEEMDWYKAEEYCSQYSVGDKKWLLPNKGAGHLVTLYKNKKDINEVLMIFGKEPLKDGYSWASEDSNYGAWNMNLIDGSMYCSVKYYHNYYVRPVILL